MSDNLVKRPRPEKIWAGTIKDLTVSGYATRVWGDDARLGTDDSPTPYIRADIHEEVFQKYLEAADRIEQLEAENKRLREALNPFAEEAEWIDAQEEKYPDNTPIDGLDAFLSTDTTLGHLRNARAALKETGK